MKIKRVLAVVSAAALLLGGLYLLFKNDAMQKVNYDKIKPFRPTFISIDNSVSDNFTDESVSQIEIDEKQKDEMTEQIQQLNQTYDNSIGWLYVPDTNIDYPVMYCGNNDFYLHHAVDGSYLYAGSIFLDYRCSNDFSSNINILYGHNMKNNSMFANVLNFRDRSYFDGHNYGWLTTENEVYVIEFFCVSQPESTSVFYDVNMDFGRWLECLKNDSLIWVETEVSESDHLICLSTCTGSEGSSRTVLIGKLIEM